MKAVLFFPQLVRDQYPLWAPLEVMAPAAMLRQAGHEVRLLDDRLQERQDEAVRAAAREAELFGISIRPGNQVPRGLAVAEMVKETNPDCTVVVGGWYGSIRGKLMASHHAVDYVVRGQGDFAVLELARALEGSGRFDEIKGLAYKHNGEIVLNPPRDMEDINTTPPLPFDMIPVERHLTREREINYVSSRGCPGCCEFCAIKCVHREEWTALEPERVLCEIEKLATDHGVERIHFTDTNFFADRHRTIRFCEEKIRRKLPFLWWALGKVADLIQEEDDFFDLLRRSGSYCIEVGAESGSKQVLELYQKGIEPGDLIEFARILRRHDLGGSMNWMLGPPGEKRRDFYDTYRVAAEVQRIKPDMDYRFFRFSPIPTSTLGERALACGMKLPARGEELPQYKFYVDSPVMPWISPFHERRIKRAFFFYFPLAFWTPDLDDSSHKTKVLRAVRYVAHLRLRIGCLAFPVEWWLYWLLTKVGLMAEGRLYAWR